MAYNFQVQYAFLSPSASGLTTVVAAQAGSRIIVLQCCVITSGSNVVNFADSAAGAVSASFPLATNGGFVLPYSQVGWMQTSIGGGLQINMTASVETGIQVVWCLSST